MTADQAVSPLDGNEEIISLIETLDRTEKRLEELTAGQVDTVSDRAGHAYMLRRAQDHYRNTEAARQAGVLNALPANVALLDNQGEILSVNEAWRRFGRANGLHAHDDGVGLNYLSVCEQAQGDGSAEGRLVADGLRRVLARDLAFFSYEYACHTDARRWFRLSAAPLNDVGPASVVVMHMNVTSETQSALALLASETRFRQMAESIRDAFFLRESGGGSMLYVSPAYEEIWGRSRESLYADSASWMAAIHPDDREAAIERHRAGALEGRFSMEYRIVRPDGSIRWIQSRGFPVRDEDKVVRIAGVARDITARKNAELALARSTRALKMLSDCNEALIRATSEDALLQAICEIAVKTGGYLIAGVAYSVDDETKTVVMRARAGGDENFFKALPMSWAANREGGLGPAGRAITTGEVIFSADLAAEAALSAVEADIRRARVGGAIFMPLKGPQGTYGVFALYCGEDVTMGENELALMRELTDDLAFGIEALRSRAERARAEGALVVSLQEKDALLKEVHHRVKNNMQVITSLLSLESRRIEHPATRAVLNEMKDRIFAMASVHESLYRSGNFAEVDLGPYLRRLTQHLGGSQLKHEGRVTFRLELISVRLDLDQAIPCGLIVNELISNALKHAFPGERNGIIRLDLDRVDEERVSLRISDDGVGVPADFEAKQNQSMGLRLVSDLTRQIHGEFKVELRPTPSFEVIFAPRRIDHALHEGARP